MKRQRVTFTLVEIILVSAIIWILVIIGISSYRKAVLRTRDKEAQVMLRSIKEAEKMFRLKYGVYASCGNTSQCNEMLGLDLPTGNFSYWNYSVNTIADSFCSQAVYNERSWFINESMENPELGLCP